MAEESSLSTIPTRWGEPKKIKAQLAPCVNHCQPSQPGGLGESTILMKIPKSPHGELSIGPIASIFPRKHLYPTTGAFRGADGGGEVHRQPATHQRSQV